MRFQDMKAIRIQRDQDGKLMVWQNPRTENVTHLAIPIEWLTEQMMIEFNNIRSVRTHFRDEEENGY